MNVDQNQRGRLATWRFKRSSYDSGQYNAGSESQNIKVCHAKQKTISELVFDIIKEVMGFQRLIAPDFGRKKICMRTKT